MERLREASLMGERGREPQELEKDSSVVEEPVAERRVLLCNGKKKFVFMVSSSRKPPSYGVID